MVRLYALLFLSQVALAATALISCLSAERDQIRALPRFAWVLIILVFPLIGPIAWFYAGRPAGADRAGGTAPGGALGQFRPRERPRQAAPDDDPEFLKSLSAEQSQKDREMFDKWEEDLRRREKDLRREDLRHNNPDGQDRKPPPDQNQDGEQDQDRERGREEKHPES